MTRTPVFQNVISSFRHYVITSLTSFVQNHHKNRRNLLDTCSLQRQKARISLRASCALSTIVNNLKQNYSSLLTQKTMEKRRESKKMRNFVGAFDCIDKLNLPCGSHLHNKNNYLPRVFSGSEAEPTIRKKKRMMKRNYLTINHFRGG